MNPTQRTAYRFFIQMIVLLILYALAALAGAVMFVSPEMMPAGALPYHQLAPLATGALSLAALTGLLGGGVYAAASARADFRMADERLLRFGAGLWMALLVLVVAAGLLGLLDGRYLWPLPAALEAIRVIAAGLIALVIFRGAPRTPVVQVWLVGLAISLLCGLVSLLSGSLLNPRALQTAAAGVNLYLACPLMAVALGFWLMRRFSTVTLTWADTGVYSVAGMVTLAGAPLAASPLVTLSSSDAVILLGNLSAALIPILYLIFAAHAYHALSARNSTRTLAAHWFALGLLLFLIGPGLLGALQAAPAISRWTLGTRLSDLQSTLGWLAPVAVGLGMANQAAAELRGTARRVTGFIPFWLVSFGVIIAALALGAAGVAQTYMERRLSIGYLDVQALLVPLYGLWLGGLVLVALGVGVYGLTFWRRRPAL